MPKDDTALDLTACVQALQDIVSEPDRAKAIAETALADMMRRRMGLVVVPEGRIRVHIPGGDGLAWAKWVWRTDRSQKGGFAFEGPFLPLGSVQALPESALVLIVGDRRQGERMAVLATVDDRSDDGLLLVDRVTSAKWWKRIVQIADAFFDRTPNLPSRLTPTAEEVAALVGHHAPPDHTDA